MKQFSGLDLARWIKLNKPLIDTSRITQIYRQGENQVCFALNTKEGKFFLISIPPEGLILSHKQPQSSHKETGFGTWMRQNLKGAIINEINQIKSERILEFKFNKGNMYVELFNKGNIICTDPEGKILITLKKQIMKERQLAKGEIYQIPESFDTFHANKKEYENYIKQLLPEEITASKFFATFCILGGKNAELICHKLNISTEDKLEKLIGKEEEIVKVFEELTNEKADFENQEREYFDSEIKESQSKYQEKIEKVEKIIKQQTDTLKKTHENIEKNSEIGEFIYNNYQFFDELKQAYEYSIKNKLDLTEEVIEKIKNKHNITIDIKFKKPEVTFKL